MKRNPKSLENRLLNAKKIKFENRRLFPRSPGCFLAWKDDTIIYVGETNNLHRRMVFLGRTWNHSLRVSIGRKVFGEEDSSAKKFSDDIENKLDDYFRENISLSYVEVDLGRTELEELIIEKYKPEYNIIHPDDDNQ